MLLESYIYQAAVFGHYTIMFQNKYKVAIHDQGGPNRLRDSPTCFKSLSDKLRVQRRFKGTQVDALCHVCTFSIVLDKVPDMNLKSTP